MAEDTQQAVIEEAGGLVWRRTGRGAELAVLFDSSQQEWKLPKGHLEPGETRRAAAVREVFEETGCRVRLGSFAGTVKYLTKAGQKVIMFWNMGLDGECQFQPSHEASALVWLPVDDALHTLSREEERRLLRQVAERKWPRKYRKGTGAT